MCPLKNWSRFGLVLTSIIPATSEAEVGGLWSESSPSKSAILYLKTNEKAKKTGACLK
jgi:hypothetical protein